MRWPEVTYFNGRPAVSGYNLKKHPLYPTWKSMRQRCSCVTCKDYPSYGGRGIKVCERWDNPNGDSHIEGFVNFVNDMGYKPETSLQVDRIDNNMGYSPDNCRWVTSKENNNNRRMPSKVRRFIPEQYGPHPYRYFYKDTGKWGVKVPNGDGTFFTKYGLTEKESEMLVNKKMNWRAV